MKRPSWILALAATLASFATLAPFASAVDTPDTTAASAGAAWLVGQINADGFVPSISNPAIPDYGTTTQVALAVLSADRANDDGDRALDYLAAHVEDVIAPGGVDNPGRISWLIMAARADGRNVTTFGGVNLVARLQATMQTAGDDAGLFGTQDPTYDGAYRQGLALNALKAAGVVADPLATGWLISQRCANGAWMSYRADTAVPCPPSDPVTFSGPDTNSTAMAMMGLKNHNINPLYATLEWLAAARTADGGYPFVPGGSADPNSTALVVQSLIRVGRIDDPLFPTDEFAALAQFQLGCDAPEPDRGAFFFPGSSSANVIATAAAIPALMGQYLPLVLANQPSGALIPLSCTTTTTTTEPTTTTTTTEPTTTTTTTEPTTTTTTTEPTTTTTTTEPTTTTTTTEPTTTTTTTEPTTTTTTTEPTTTTTTTEPTTTTTTTEPTTTTTTTEPTTTTTTTEPTTTTTTTEPTTTTTTQPTTTTTTGPTTTATTGASVLGNNISRGASSGSTRSTRSTRSLATTGNEPLRWTLVALASVTLGALVLFAGRRIENQGPR